VDRGSDIDGRRWDGRPFLLSLEKAGSKGEGEGEGEGKTKGKRPHL
jgi:hypothetical protein